MQTQFILRTACQDGPGIVQAVSGFIADRGGSITEANHYSDPLSQVFFMRNVIAGAQLQLDKAGFERGFADIAKRFKMDWTLTDGSRNKRVVVLVSKQEHCLYDLLGRWSSGELEMDIACIISNHETHRALVEFHGIPFHLIAVSKENKSQAYAHMAQIIDAAEADAIVLARYMQILSPELCERFAGKILNIHHSMLPSFVGAKPYHQAYERGVKVIGATCHYVTSELDEGPIIEQDVVRIDHSSTPDELVRYGKDVEKTVLAKGLRYHLEDRVMLHGRRTIVFK